MFMIDPKMLMLTETQKPSPRDMVALLQDSFRIRKSQHAQIWNELQEEEYDVGYLDLMMRMSMSSKHPSMFYSEKEFLVRYSSP